MIHLGTRLELFVDHFLLDSLTDLRLQLHHPVSANTAITWDRPWEGAFCGYVTVIKTSEKWLLYYRGWPSTKGEAVYCYAESKDGVSFQRPSLGLKSVNGSRDNNVILAGDDHGVHNFSPFLDTRPGVPEAERFKALGSTHKSVMAGLIAFASPDGVHWRTLSDEAVITKGKFDSQNVAFWSELEGCYVSFYRESRKSEGESGYGIRTMSRATSVDFLNWSEPVEMTYGDTPYEQLYTNQTAPYFRAPHLYLAFPKRFVQHRQTMSDEEAASYGVIQPYQTEVSDGVFMTSRGGSSYDRTFMEAFLRPGRERANWVSRTNMCALGVWPTAPDELSLYYQHRYAQPAQYLQRYTLRTDGFSSVQAPYAGGEFLTKPFSFTGNRLVINYATSAPGSIFFELQDESGNALPGLSMEECDPIFGDEIARNVTWQGKHDLQPWSGLPIRLRARMADADLFSIQFPGGDR